ncbi:hypothetical protein ACI78V_05200 [Geodermatophilus sp. SYSU D00742]
MLPNNTTHLNHNMLPGGQLSSEQVSELALMKHSGRTWTVHRPGSDNDVVIAARLAQAADTGQLDIEHPAMVLTGTVEAARRITAQLRCLLPTLLIQDLAADPRMNAGYSTRSRLAVQEDAHVRVITYELFRLTRLSFHVRNVSMVLLDQVSVLADGGNDYDFAQRLSVKAPSVHLFGTARIEDDIRSTFHLGNMLGLVDWPPTLQRFKTRYASITGYGRNEVAVWSDSSIADLEDRLDLHYYVRKEQPSSLELRVIIPDSRHKSSYAAWTSMTIPPLPRDWCWREPSR